MLKYLILLIIAVPLIELWGIFTAGQWIGWLPTLALCFFTGVAGAWLAKTQGLKTIIQAREQLGRGYMPGDALLDGLSILAGGIFLLTPGFFSDIIGFVLLLPWTRAIVKRWIKKWLEKKLVNGTFYYSNFDRFNRW